MTLIPFNRAKGQPEFEALLEDTANTIEDILTDYHWFDDRLSAIARMTAASINVLRAEIRQEARK